MRNHQPSPLDSAKGSVSPQQSLLPGLQQQHPLFLHHQPQYQRQTQCVPPALSRRPPAPASNSINITITITITSTIPSYQPGSLVGFITQPWSLESSQAAVLASLNQLPQEYQAGKTTQANILLEIEKVNGLCKDISRLAAVETSQQEILAAVRALKPSGKDERANQATNGMMSANLKKNR
ncbi:hypothetical protein LZL87_010032 [Fusarium oxysporum]|nr:hypothetical protein LZL87_010032 [Fusarium oxysporum]